MHSGFVRICWFCLLSVFFHLELSWRSHAFCHLDASVVIVSLEGVVNLSLAPVKVLVHHMGAALGVWSIK